MKIESVFNACYFPIVGSQSLNNLLWISFVWCSTLGRRRSSWYTNEKMLLALKLIRKYWRKINVMTNCIFYFYLRKFFPLRVWVCVCSRASAFLYTETPLLLDTSDQRITPFCVQFLWNQRLFYILQCIIYIVFYNRSYRWTLLYF